MRRLEAWVVGGLLAVFAVGLALVPLQVSWFTRTLASHVAELPPDEALPLAENARRFVVAGDADARAALEDAMTPAAVKHLDDVRAVLGTANRAVGALGLVLLAWALVRARRDRPLAAAALARGALVLAAGALLGFAVALVDFDAFFAGFHRLFFAEGTWMFPSDSVLILLFPEPFWTWAGATWAGLVLIVAAVYAIASRLLGAPAMRADTG